MDPLKEAFSKVGEDIDFLFAELQDIKRTLTEFRNEITAQQTNQHRIQTNQHSTPSQLALPTDIPTRNMLLEPSKTQYNGFSTRNVGVPTNNQTIQPTNQHPPISYGNSIFTQGNSKMDQLKRVSEIIGSLDEIKKEVRIKFKQLTDQEMTIYSLIYHLEEQGLIVDYSLLAEKTSLTEISIRDYIRKITKKGIELEKSKQNNKKVILSIPSEIKKIASLQTLLHLRDL